MNLREQIEGDPGAAAQELNRRLGGDFWVTFSSRALFDGVPLGVRMPGVTGLAAQFTADSEGRAVVTGLLLLGDAITAEALRKVPIATLENSIALTSGPSRQKMRDLHADLATLPPLERAEGMAPEQFSQIVAAHYRVWARYTPHPAAGMAAHWNVKAPTVATWIREARLRGLLPAARGRSKTARVEPTPSAPTPKRGATKR